MALQWLAMSTISPINLLVKSHSKRTFLSLSPQQQQQQQSNVLDFTVQRLKIKKIALSNRPLSPHPLQELLEVLEVQVLPLLHLHLPDEPKKMGRMGPIHPGKNFC